MKALVSWDRFRLTRSCWNYGVPMCHHPVCLHLSRLLWEQRKQTADSVTKLRCMQIAPASTCGCCHSFNGADSGNPSPSWSGLGLTASTVLLHPHSPPDLLTVMLATLSPTLNPGYHWPVDNLCYFVILRYFIKWHCVIFNLSWLDFFSLGIMSWRANWLNISILTPSCGQVRAGLSSVEGHLDFFPVWSYYK